MTESNVNSTAANEFDIPMDPPADAPQPAAQVQNTLELLEKLMQGGPADGADDAAGDDGGGAGDGAPAGDGAGEGPSEIDTIMASLEDEPQAIKDAVRASLEKGMKLEAALAEIQEQRASEESAKLQAKAEENLIAEATDLTKKYPGFTEADLVTTLSAISKMPKALAEALTLEESAARALGREVLESRRSAPTTPRGDAPAVPRTSDPAVVIGDATPGPGAADKPFDAGTGGDFMDIANFVTKTAGNSLVAGSQR